MMEQRIINNLKDLGYDGPILDQTNLKTALDGGPKNVEYTKLINYLTNELRTLLNIDEEVNVISSAEDSTTFIMEISSFLKELSCPYSGLTQGHISERLESIEDRLLLIDYLSTELMGARILQEKKPDKKIELKLKETQEAAWMRKILMALRFPKPPPNLTVETLFQKLIPTLETHISKASKELLGNPAFFGTLSDKQWATLNNVATELNTEYKIRREMLLTRLDVTIQSFQWSDRTKGKEELFEKIYSEKRRLLKTDPNVNISDLLAARDDIAIIEKTSNSDVRKNTRSSLNKVIIGQVPDRGGRTSEQAPPPPEMPSWQKRTAGPPGGGGGRGGRGAGGGGGGGNYQNTGRQNYSRGNESSYENKSFANRGGSGGNYDNSGSYGGGNYKGNTPTGSYQGRTNYDSAGSYNQGRSNYDSAGTYNQGRNSYDSSSGNYNQGRSYDNSGSYNQNRSFDSAGSYGGSSYNQGGYASQSSYDNNRRSSYDNKSFDSAGSYGKDTQYEQHSKRAKTYDSYQSNRTTYADQYVQEEQQNQQYRNRGGGQGNRGGGRSNYNRGGGGRRY